MAKAVENNMAALLKGFQKQYGDKIGGLGAKVVQVERVPTGIFQFDLATGGGFPRGRASIVYGPESSGKTNLALSAIREHQRRWPKLKCVFFDVENSFDPGWAALLGVDVDNLYVIKPDYAEQCVDMVEALLYGEDCGLVVLDSLAALVTTNETQSSAEKANVGGASNPVGKLVRKSTLAFIQAEKQGKFPTLLYINQIRHKIGVMFGNPETMPGGNAPKFQSTLTVRTYGRNIMDKKVSDVKPVRKQTDAVIQKWKAPIVALKATWDMATVAHKGLVPGQCDDWPTIQAYMEKFGLFTKAPKGGYLMCDAHYPTIEKARLKLMVEDPNLSDTVRKAIIEQCVEDAGGGIIPTTTEEEDTSYAAD